MKQFMAVMGFAALVVSAGGHEGLGISSWCGWKPGQVSRADCPELRSVPLVLHWKSLEPKPGRYEFDKYIGEPLRAAAQEPRLPCRRRACENVRDLPNTRAVSNT